MPIYEYSCSNCNHQFEVIQKINDEPVKVCPECSNKTVIRLVSPTSFQLKGTGWYVTDFKDKPKESSLTKDAPSTKPTTDSATTETKKSSATTPESKGSTD